MTPAQQDRLLKPLGLRRRFRKRVRWSERALAIVRERVMPDARRFLAAYGKPEDFWQF